MLNFLFDVMYFENENLRKCFIDLRKDEKNYKSAKLNGLYRSWHENGQLYYEGNWKDGYFEGNFKEYYENERN